MSQNQFSSLMTKYGNEAEQQKVEEARAAERTQKSRHIRRICLLVILAGAIGSLGVFRSEVSAGVSAVATKFHHASPYAKAQQNTEAKIADIKAQAEKRKQAIEGTFK